MILNRAATLIVLSPNCSLGVLTIFTGRVLIISLFFTGVGRRAKFSCCFSASFRCLFFLAFFVSLRAEAGLTWVLPLVIFYFLAGAAPQFSSFLRDLRKSCMVLGLGRVFFPQKTGFIGETFGVDCLELGRAEDLEVGLTVILVVFNAAVVTSPEN